MIEFVFRFQPCGEIEKLEQIIRCIDCKHRFDISNDTHWCGVWDRETWLYEFCSNGEGEEGTQ